MSKPLGTASWQRLASLVNCQTEALWARVDDLVCAPFDLAQLRGRE
jgi:hypothetical protein